MKEKKTAEFAGSIFAAIVGIVFYNSVPAWRHLTRGVILDTWIDILWAANLSLVIQIIGNIALAYYRPIRLYSFIQFIFSAANLLSIIVFYIVFPVDFTQLVGDWMNSAMRILLMITMGGTMISGLVHFLRLLFKGEYETDKKKFT